ncbi:MAG: hypothetical protein JAY90_19035 [Candidatus Thiodiazotropha lotti]|nr:hypothetical protein [Candidatus Thiodiazotropha lotti]
MQQDAENNNSAAEESIQELESFLGSYMYWKEKLGLLSYSERIAKLISQLDYTLIKDILDNHLSNEENRRRLWSPDLVEECNQFILGFSPQYNHSYLRLDDDDPYNENLFVWVDGCRLVPPPNEDNDEPFILQCGIWVSNDLLILHIQTLYGHPFNTYNLFLRNDKHLYQRIYSLLLWDCRTQCMHVEHPSHKQIWIDPRVRVDSGKLLTYPTKLAYKENKPDGLMPFPF